jgi:glyoxylase-like metal-dependent hydrolase (beta-lactamase superfamily II)
MLLEEAAEGVWLMPAFVPWLINAYLVRTDDGDVLIDAGTRWVTGLILRALRGRKLAMVGLTHVHPDHQGAAHDVCSRFRVPLACHQADVDVMEGRRPMGPSSPLGTIFRRLWAGPPHPVSRRWRGGETFGEWAVVPAPGHTPGHVVFHRRRDGVVIVGDVIRNAALRTGMGVLSETPHFFSVDPAENRRSMRRVLELSPRRMLFGHGPPSEDVAGLERLVRKVGA